MTEPANSSAVSRTASPRPLYLRTMSMLVGWLIRGGAAGLVQHVLDDLDG